jgi:DNA-binding XRE family transcriptional regulator
MTLATSHHSVALQQLRRRAGMSRDLVAITCDISPRLLYRVEAGRVRPSRTVLVDLIRAYTGGVEDEICHTRWVNGFGSTHDWPQAAPGPFVWVAYLRCGLDQARRLRGFAATREEAAATHCDVLSVCHSWTAEGISHALDHRQPVRTA